MANTTSVTITPADLAITNPALVPLTGRRYSSNFTAVPNHKLPTAMQATLAKMYLALTGAELPVDGATIAVSSDSGYFKRLYTPKVYADGAGSCYIKWGDVLIPLTCDEGKLVPVHKQPGYKVGIKLATANPSDRGDDPAIEVKVTETEAKQVYSGYFALAVSDWKGYVAGDYETVLETDYGDFVALLMAESAGGGGGAQIEGDVTSTKAILAAAFPNGQNYDVSVTVTGYKPVNAGGRATAILQCSAIDDEAIVAAVPCTGKAFGLWADPSVRPMLLSSPEITEAKPATLVMPAGPGARPRLLVDSEATVVAPGGLQLDF